MSIHCHACACVIKSDDNLECERCRSRYCSEACYNNTLTTHLKHCKTISMFQKEDSGESINIGNVLEDTKLCLQSFNTEQIVECFKTLPFDTIVHALGASRVVSQEELERNSSVCEKAVKELNEYDFLQYGDAEEVNEVYLSMGNDSNTIGSPKYHVLYRKDIWEVAYWESSKKEIRAALNRHKIYEGEDDDENAFEDQIYKWLASGPIVKKPTNPTDKNLVDGSPRPMKVVSLYQDQILAVLDVSEYSDIGDVEKMRKETMIKTKKLHLNEFIHTGSRRKKKILTSDIELYWTTHTHRLCYPKIDIDAISQEFWSKDVKFVPPKLVYAVMIIKAEDGSVIPYIIGVRYARNISMYNIEEEESTESAKHRRIAENVRLSSLVGIKRTLRSFGEIYSGLDVQTKDQNGWFLVFQHYFEYLANLMRWSRRGFKTGKNGAQIYWDILKKYRSNTELDLRKGEKLYNKLTMGGWVPIHFPGVLLTENVVEFRVSGSIMLPSRFYEPSRLHSLRILEIGPGLAENVAILLWDENSYEKGEMELDVPLYSFIYTPSKFLRLPETLYRAKNLGSLTLQNVVIEEERFPGYELAFGNTLVSLSLSDVKFGFEKEEENEIEWRKSRSQSLNAFLKYFTFLEVLTLVDMDANDDTMEVLVSNQPRLINMKLEGSTSITRIPDVLQERIVELTANAISNTGSIDLNNVRAVEIRGLGFPDIEEVEFSSSEDGFDEGDKIHQGFVKHPLTKKQKVFDDTSSILIEGARLDAETENSGERVRKALSDPVYNIYIDSTGVNDKDNLVERFSTQIVKGYGNLVKAKNGSEWVSVFIKCESQPITAVTKFFSGDWIYDQLESSELIFKSLSEIEMFGKDEMRKIFTTNELNNRFAPIIDSRPNGFIIRTSNENNELIASTGVIPPDNVAVIVTSQFIFANINGDQQKVGVVGLSPLIELDTDKTISTRMRFVIYHDDIMERNIIIGINVLMQTSLKETPLSEFGFDAIENMEERVIDEGNIFVPDVFVSGLSLKKWFSEHLRNGVNMETAKKMETLWMNATLEYINIDLSVEHYDEDVPLNIDIKSYISWKNMQSPIQKIQHWNASPRNIHSDGGWRELVERFNGLPGDGVEVVGFIAGELENETRSLLPNNDPIKAINITVGRKKNRQDRKYKVFVDMPRSSGKKQGVSSSTAWIVDKSAGTTNLIQFTKLTKMTSLFDRDIHFPYCDMKQTTAPGASKGSLVPIELDISMTTSNIMLYIGMQAVNILTWHGVDIYSHLSESQVHEFTDRENAFRNKFVDISKSIKNLIQERRNAEGNHQKTVDIEAIELVYREEQYQKLIFMYFIGLCIDELYKYLVKNQSLQVVQAKKQFEFLIGWIVERVPNIDVEKEKNILQPQLDGDGSLYTGAEECEFEGYEYTDINLTSENSDDVMMDHADAF